MAIVWLNDLCRVKAVGLRCQDEGLKARMSGMENPVSVQGVKDAYRFIDRRLHILSYLKYCSS